MSLETTFLIPAMDCPSEEAIIRKRLGNMNGVIDLQFDLMARKLTIIHDNLDPASLRSSLHVIGMTPAEADLPPDGHSACCCGHDPCDNNHPGKAARPQWVQHASFILAGVLAILCEVLYFAGVEETSWPIIVLAVISMLLAGRQTFRKGWIALRTFTLNIHFLMCVAVVGGAIVGAWPEIALVVFLFELAELLEARALDRARNAVRSLMTMTPPTVTMQQADGSWQTTEAGLVPVGAIIQVKPGERLALDGVVTGGESSVNQAPVTGESIPVDKTKGDPVYAGTINETGVLMFKTTGGKDQTTLAGIIKTVQEAQASRAPTQRLVDHFARYYTPLVCLVAMLVAVLPWALFGQPFWPWFYKALVLLVVACPCALVISTPVTVVSGLTMAARQGILIKGGVHLENGRKLRIIALDKTGTITQGQPRVTDIHPMPGVTQDRLLQTAASLDALSQHPVAKAIVAAWPGPLQNVVAFKSLTGRGVEGTIQSQTCFAGNHRLLKERGLSSPEIETLLTNFEAQGKTAIIVASEDQCLGVLAVADTPRESSVEAIRQLHATGVRTLLLSGDNPQTAQAIASQVGIDEAQGGLLPEDKLAQIKQQVQSHGQVVGMVGDGVNDAPALAAATVGFAMGMAGTDTALETADVTLMQDDLRSLPEYIRLSRRVGAVLAQNIALAIGIKGVFFILTLLGLATMWMAVIADVGATLLVVANGLRILRPTSR